ncbi:uncharacterized protein BDZ99DRAFT_463703 [Mytilinidion resinicola]|uniref:Uncharacterized protein n=1 Tax=Mytilinidion resinicola TaxID=574789 RepID=A0A6A6YJX5_9PEZI|nr:uncharacterized protein BDZ99DRAFT_463703 [Mytilinidion resinicola]KAF2808833.1 hypothetical protein BDZ99DRAFT_463703 [Mytilinidion resinicola]
MYKRGAASAGEQFASKKMALPVYILYSYRFDQTPWNRTEDAIVTVAPVFSTHYSGARHRL